MTRPAASRATTRADIAASIERRMQQQNPAAAANDAMRSLIRLPIRTIDLYERNPRTKPNARLADIKEAIRNTGENEQPPIVTRRPGAERYVVGGGGNTRVLAQRELYDETGDPRFASIDCIYKPYVNETELLAAHIAENSNRDDLCFRDNAHAIMALRADIEQDRGRQLSLRELADEVGKIGVTAGRQWLAVFKFTVERLGALQHAGIELTSKDVHDRIQPAYARLGRLAGKLSIDASTLEEQTFLPALELARIRYERSGKLDVPGLVATFNERFADVACISTGEVERLVQILERQSDLDEAALRALIRAPEQPPLLPQDGQEERDDEEGDAAPDPVGGMPVRSAAGSLPAAEPRVRQTPLSAESPVPRRAAPDRFLAANSATSSAPHDRISGAAEPEPVISTGDVRTEFERAVERFAHACGIGECLRTTDVLPFWFMVELPLLQTGERPLDAQAADDVRPERYFGWWWLVFLSSQNTPAGMQLIPDGSFARICQSNEIWEDACLETIGEQVGPDQFFRIITSMCNPDDAVGALYFDLLSTVRRLREAYPERFSPQFWTGQGGAWTGNLSCGRLHSAG